MKFQMLVSLAFTRNSIFIGTRYSLELEDSNRMPTAHLPTIRASYEQVLEWG